MADETSTLEAKCSCPQPYFEFWGNASGWHCKICKAGFAGESPEATIAEEQRKEALRLDMEAFGGDPERSSEASWMRGVTVSWLTSWTNAHDCWDYTTRKVCLEIVMKETQSRRCRYVELDGCVSEVGPADVFISHAWGATWGNIVGAIAGILDPDTRVWLDLFAVRQWPGNDADLDFTGVVKRCKSFIVVIPSLSTLRDRDSFFTRRDLALLLPLEDRNRLPFLRYWCLVEIAEAIRQGMPVVCMGGSGIRGADGVHFSYDNNMLVIASQCIDVESAEATNPDDKAKLALILQKVPGGAQGVNRLIRRLLYGASLCNSVAIDGSNPILSDAALGRMNCLEAFFHANETDKNALNSMLCAVAAGGFIAAARFLLDHGVEPSFKRKDQQDKSAMSCAALGGSIAILELLLKAGANVNRRHIGDFTPIVFAATRNNAEAIVYLFEAGGDVHINGSNAALLYSEETKSHRAYWVVSILSEIQRLENLLFALDPDTRSPELKPLVDKVKILLRLTDENDAMDAEIEMEDYHSELSKMMKVLSYLLSYEGIHVKGGISRELIRPFIVRSIVAGAANDCFDSRAGRSSARTTRTDDCLDKIFENVVGKDTGTLIVNLADLFENGSLPNGDDLAQLSGEFKNEEQEVALALMFFATGAMQQHIDSNGAQNEESYLVLCARYEYGHLCRILIDLGLGLDLESLEIILEDEPETLQFLRHVHENRH